MVQVISLGHKDNVTVTQVKQNTEMESHEEKLHKMIIQSKINDTKVWIWGLTFQLLGGRDDATKERLEDSVVWHWAAQADHCPI